MPERRRRLARTLAAVSVAALLMFAAALTPGTGWLLLLLAGTALLALHARTDLYALLVLGALLIGAAAGNLLEVALGWSGAFFVSVGSAAMTVEALAERRGQWALIFGLALIGLGLILGVLDAGATTTLLAAALLLTLLLYRLRAGVREGA